MLSEGGNVGTARARPDFLLGSFALPGRAQENHPTASCQLPSCHLPTASGQQLPHKHEPLLTASRAKPAGQWRHSIGFGCLNKGMNYPSQPCARCVRESPFYHDWHDHTAFPAIADSRCQCCPSSLGSARITSKRASVTVTALKLRDLLRASGSLEAFR